MALSDAELARLQAFVDAVPAGPWWWVVDEGDVGSEYCTTKPPRPWDLAAGRLPAGKAAVWSMHDRDPETLPDNDDTWDYRCIEPGDVGVDWLAAMHLADAARDAIPALVAEVQRLRAALAAIVDRSAATTEDTVLADLEARAIESDSGDYDYAEGFVGGLAAAADLAAAALKEEASRDGTE